MHILNIIRTNCVEVDLAKLEFLQQKFVDIQKFLGENLYENPCMFIGYDDEYLVLYNF